MMPVCYTVKLFLPSSDVAAPVRMPVAHRTLVYRSNAIHSFVEPSTVFRSISCVTCHLSYTTSHKRRASGSTLFSKTFRSGNPVSRGQASRWTLPRRYALDLPAAVLRLAVIAGRVSHVWDSRILERIERYRRCHPDGGRADAPRSRRWRCLGRSCGRDRLVASPPVDRRSITRRASADGVILRTLHDRLQWRDL